MDETTRIGLFNNKIIAFNKAVEEKDISLIKAYGSEIIKIALEECVNPNVLVDTKDVYKRKALAVLEHLKNNISETYENNNKPSDSNSQESDPFYVEKNWFSEEVPDLNFSNVIGLQDVKDAFMVDVVAPLKPQFKEIYKKFRGDEKGSQILLWGPPGTGKTFIAKCMAGALNCPIAVVQTSEVLAGIVGVAEKNIRDIFNQASKLPRCIIFFDEIDSICSDRESMDSRNTKSVLTTLLTCMDGFVKTKNPDQLRIIIAATNLPWRLDPALKRGSRFDTQIYVPLPDEIARKKFVENDINRIPHDSNVTVEYLTNKLAGFSGADIKAILRQIANQPLKREVKNMMKGGQERGERVTLQDCEKVISGYINGVTPEMLERFKAYELGVSYEDYLLIKAKNKANS